MMVKILNIILFLLASLSLSAQGKQKKEGLENLVLSLSEVYKDAQILIDSMSLAHDVKDGLWNDFLDDKNIDELKQERTNFTDATSGFPDLGLKWVSEVNSNFNQDISDSEDMFSRLRLSTGIDWLIWGDGSFTRKKQDRQLLKRRLKRDNWLRAIALQDMDLKNKLHLLQGIFDAHRLILLNAYQSLIKKEFQHEMNMYDKGLANDNILLETKYEIESIKHSIDLIKRYSQQDKGSAIFSKYWNLPFGYTDLPQLCLLEEKILSNSNVKLFELNRDVLKTEKRDQSNFNLRLKLRYNYYEYKNQAGRTYPSIGLTVSVPLNFSRGNKLLKYELESQSERFEQECTSLLKELKDGHRHFYLLKKELLDLENDLEYIKSLLNSETTKETQSRQEFTPITYINLSKQFIRKKSEILDKQQELCEEYIEFYLRAGFLSAENEISTSGSQPSIVPSTVAHQNLSTYLWGHFFKKKTNEELLNILVNSNINTIFFSPADSDSIKTVDFITRCNSKDIQVYRLISENSYASSDAGSLKLQKKLEEINGQGFVGIHLNIEPHTFDDYRENLSVYIERMNNLFKETKQWCDDHHMALSVSVPMHIPLETALVLKEKQIDAYIMAYESEDHLKLLQRTAVLRGVLSENVSWALRISDFESADDIKRTMVLLHNYGILKLAYYDCSLLDKIVE